MSYFHFVKAYAIEKSKNISDIDLDNKENILPLKTVNTGFAAEGTISKLIASDMLNLSEVKTFRRECIKFVAFTLKKLFERSPVSCTLVKNASCLKPEELISESDHNQLKMKRFLRYLVNCKILNESQSDLALRQYHSFLRDDCKTNADKIPSFKKNKDRLDDFYFHQLHRDKYKELASVLKILFTISLGQASVERGFNLNKAILKDNIEQTSVISRRLIKDHLIMRNVKPHTIEIFSKLILDVNSSRMKYESYLEE